MKILIAIAILALICISSLFFLSSDTALKIDPPVQVVGASTPVTVQTTGPHGVRRVSAFIEQGGAKMPLLDQSTPSHHLFWRKNQPPQTVTFDAGRGKAPNLKEGDAKLVVEAVTDDFRGSTATASLPVKVVLAPPRVVGDEYQHYVNQGGMELAVMTPSGSWTDSGVKVGDHRFRSFPLPGQPGQRFAMFAYPWDQAVEVAPLVYARNAAGNEATAAVWFKLFPKKFRVRDFELKDEDMARLVSQIDPNGTLAPGPDMLTRFLKINGDLREGPVERPLPALGQGRVLLRRRPQLHL